MKDVIINWYGGGCYKITASNADIIIDPHSSPSGNRLKGDLVIQTEIDCPIDLTKIVNNEITIPGEYELLGVTIKGAPIFSGEKHLKVIYKIKVDNINIALLGNISEELTEELLDMLGDIDILLFPSNSVAGKLIKSIDPYIAIPGWGDPKVVITETGQSPEVIDKLVIKKKDIETDKGVQLVLLKQ